METLKELKDKHISQWLGQELFWYREWYKDALELMFNDIVNAEVTSVATIEKWLQNLLNK